MRTIAVMNQKGGCGKTTTAVNMAAALAESGKRVLLVDFDPQAHATIGLGTDPDSLKRTVYDLVIDPDWPLAGVIVHCETERVDLLPSNVMLASAELELAALPDKELRLARALRSIRDSYDVCVIDSPASVGLLTVNGLVMSSDVVVPVQVHYYALEGLKRLLETVRFIREVHPYSMENIRLLLTFVEERAAFSRKIQQQLRDIFGDLVLDTVIHRDNRLAESPGASQSILRYAARSKGAADYRALAAEILTGSPKTAPVAVEKIRKGIQKHLATLFEGVWIPQGTRSYNPGSVDAT